MSDYTDVRQKDSLLELFLSIPCPVCDAAVGKPCLSHSGLLRIEPHVERKLVIVESEEKN